MAGFQPSLRRWWEGRKWKLLEWLCHAQIRNAAWLATRELDRSNPPKILVDNSILRFGVTHSNAWISTGTKLWGKTPVETGYLARVSKNYPIASEWIAKNEVPYFAPLVHLGLTGHIQYVRSRDLETESVRHPPSKYVGDFYGLNVWTHIKFDHVDFVSRHQINRIWSPESWSKKQQIEDIKSLDDPEFSQLVAILGQHHILDCLHLWTAHRAGCFAFLTVDAKFVRHFENSYKMGKLDWLKARPYFPSQIAKLWRIRPVSIEHLTPLNASFPYVIR